MNTKTGEFRTIPAGESPTEDEIPVERLPKPNGCKRCRPTPGILGRDAITGKMVPCSCVTRFRTRVRAAVPAQVHSNPEPKKEEALENQDQRPEISAPLQEGK